MKYISCVILSGGKSSRMQKDKSLLPFANKSSLALYQYERLKPYFKKVYISSKENKFDFIKDEKTLILDEGKESFSPIVGLKSILSKLDEKKIFILTVDTPFVSISSIEKIIKNAKDCDICVAQTQRTHNLCGVFYSSILLKLDEMLQKDIHKVGYLLKKCKSKYINFSNEDEFLNLNKPQDYQKALEIQDDYI